MMLLIFLALLTSAILLPAMIVAYRTIESAIKGEENWQDYEEDAHIVSGAMDAELTS